MAMAAAYCVFGFPGSFTRPVRGQPGIQVPMQMLAARISRSTRFSNICRNQATGDLFFLSVESRL
jgi:hypothetical protein